MYCPMCGDECSMDEDFRYECDYCMWHEDTAVPTVDEYDDGWDNFEEDEDDFD